MTLRRLLVLMLVLAVVGLAAAPLWAAEANPLEKLRPNSTWRGAGFYLSWIKILLSWLVFLAWATTTDWVSRDTQEMRLNYIRWNPIVFGTFMGTFLLHWLIPWFWLGFPLLIIAYAAPLTTYVIYRNRRVLAHERVLTRDHLRHWLSDKLSTIGLKMKAEAGDPNKSGAPVSVFACGADERTNAARLLAARQSPGLPVAREIIADALAARAAAVMLDFTATSVAVRVMVDGVWLPREAREREVTDPALESLKLLCGLNPQDRKSRQEGTLRIEYSVIRHQVFDKIERAVEEYRTALTADLTRRFVAEELPPAQLQQKVAAAAEEKIRERFASPVGPWTPVDKEKLPKLEGIDALNSITSVEPRKCQATLACQGGQSAERALIQFEVRAARLETLDDLGMRTKMQEQLKELLVGAQGFVLLAAVPGGGLRSTTKAVLLGMDRFIREFRAVEDEANRYEELENIPVMTYNSAAEQSPASVLPKVFREEPNVVVVRDLVDAQTVSLICRETAVEQRLVIGTVRAKDCAEALLRVLALKTPPKEFAGQISAVLCQRLLRKLCDKCKEAYTPPPQVLQQLGIPEGRIRALFRPPQPKPGDEDRKEACRECGGIGYVGQTAIFEFLVVDDTVRKVLATTPKLEMLRQAARKAGMKTLQEEGILLAARGVTSLPELMRVLKQ